MVKRWKVKNKQYKYKKRKENDKLVTFNNSLKLGVTLFFASILGFIFYFFKNKKTIKNKSNNFTSKKSIKEVSVIKPNKKEITVSKEKVNDYKKSLNENKIMEEDKRDDSLLKVSLVKKTIDNNCKNKQKEFEILKENQKEFEMAKKIIKNNSLELKKLEKDNNTLAKLNMLKTSLNYFTLTDILFRRKHIRRLVNSVNMNNSIRSINNKEHINLNKVKNNKRNIILLTIQVNRNTLNQIQVCKTNNINPIILNELRYFERKITRNNKKENKKVKVYKI